MEFRYIYLLLNQTKLSKILRKGLDDQSSFAVFQNAQAVKTTKGIPTSVFCSIVILFYTQLAETVFFDMDINNQKMGTNSCIETYLVLKLV